MLQRDGAPLVLVWKVIQRNPILETLFQTYFDIKKTACRLVYLLKTVSEIILKYSFSFDKWIMSRYSTAGSLGLTHYHFLYSVDELHYCDSTYSLVNLRIT